MALTKLVKMLLAFALVALTAASQCDSSCRKIVLECAKAIGPYDTETRPPNDMAHCYDLLCKTWGDKCGDCGLCVDWRRSGNSTSALGVGARPRTLTTSVVTEESSSEVAESLITETSTTETTESSTVKHSSTGTPKSSITTWTSAPTTVKHSTTKTNKHSTTRTKKHSTAKTSKHSTKKHSTGISTMTAPATLDPTISFSIFTTLSTHSPPPTFAPRSPTSFDDFDPLNTCDNQCEGLFNSCRDNNKDKLPTFCRNLICQTYQHLCADCPLCYRDGPTTWPTATPTPTPAPSGPPTKRDDPTQCGFGCNINECALICMSESYIDSYRKYPGNQWFDNNGSDVSVTLRSGVWKCNAGGCTLASKMGDCWTWCDQYAQNCQLMCKGKKMGRRSDFWEVCDLDVRHCTVTCDAGKEKEKRQCREVCDEVGKCTSECVDQPVETCWQACDPQGENCREECSVIEDTE